MTTQLGGRYVMVSRIARGGMGEVWRARDELLGREVAVKLLRKDGPGSGADHGPAGWVARFRNEARITAGLTHPGIAQVFDYGEQSDLAYLVMELVQGESLSAILARHGALGTEVTLDVLQQTARALHSAHSAGIIHRDIKPGNLLVTPEGAIKVTDFGIARAMESPSVTMTGTVLGTAQYVSPEQAQGLPLTPSTDLYSLGVVAYECLSGRAPFVAETQVAIALLHLNEPPPPLGADVPAPVRDLVMRLLSKDPERRPATAAELADRAGVLRETLAGAAAPVTELSMLTDPSGFRVGRATGSYGSAVPAGSTGAYGTAETDGDLVEPVPTTRFRSRRRRRTTVLVATAGAAAAVGFGTVAVITLNSGPPPSVADPTERVTSKPSVKPTKKKPSTRRPSPVPVTPTKPVTSPSATVSKTASPTRKPTTSSPTPTRTPTRTPTTTPTSTPTTPAPSDSPDPGDTNPPEG
ncbi:protein kinase [Nonomuraea sp. NPDC050328]|uniref:serine/threonine-protein kinase n=1 Tax=Nonomuraea sp. NPDC050328 TaxID=3364361 RepID=UPI0037B4116A